MNINKSKKLINSILYIIHEKILALSTVDCVRVSSELNASHCAIENFQISFNQFSACNTNSGNEVEAMLVTPEGSSKLGCGYRSQSSRHVSQSPDCQNSEHITDSQCSGTQRSPEALEEPPGVHRTALACWGDAQEMELAHLHPSNPSQGLRHLCVSLLMSKD